jgi:hypothetical protein
VPESRGSENARFPEPATRKNQQTTAGSEHRTAVPFPDTYRSVTLTTDPPIRDVLNKIRIEMGFGCLVKYHRKRPADRGKAGLVSKTAIQTASRSWVRAIRATLS